MKLIGKHSVATKFSTLHYYFSIIDEISVKKKCEAQLVELVYAQEGHQLPLDRLMTVFEATYGHKLEFHGHSKLLKLLESFSDTLKVNLQQKKKIGLVRYFTAVAACFT